MAKQHSRKIRKGPRFPQPAPRTQKKKYRSLFTEPAASGSLSLSAPLYGAAAGRPPAGASTHWVFDLDAGLTFYLKATEKKLLDKVRLSNSTAPSKLKARRNTFAALQELVIGLTRLPEDHVMAVDEETSEHASQLLNDLSQYSVEPPKIFAHGGDAVVLTWDTEAVQRYVTVVGDELSLLDMHKPTGARVEEDFELKDSEEREIWLSRLGGAPISLSNLTDVD